MTPRHIALTVLFAMATPWTFEDADAQNTLASLQATTPRSMLVIGDTVQLQVTITLPSGTVIDLTNGGGDVIYSSDAPEVASVDASGVVTAVSRGTATIEAEVDAPDNALLSHVLIRVATVEDRDDDGLSNALEMANGLNPDDPTDAGGDLDGDGLSNLQEILIGTNPRSRDTDGDGTDDGEETRIGTNPLVFDGLLGPDCVVSVMNRSVAVNADGTFSIPNIPSVRLLERVVASCQRNGKTLSGASVFFLPAPNATTEVGEIRLGQPLAIPTVISVSPQTSTLASVGETVQLRVSGTYANASGVDITSADAGTSYSSSNAGIATITSTPAGLVTARTSGTSILSASNSGVLGTAEVHVQLNLDRDGDGLPDDYETAHTCLDPNIADPQLDPDADGLSNIAEFGLGTDPCVADSDGDGIFDGDELARGSNPVLPDSDLDGVLDGQEPVGDLDSDGIPNILDRDSDNDGLDDGIEVRICGTITCANPFADNDGDRLTNLDEVALFTNPLKFDTDEDGLGDGEEVLNSTDPLIPDHTPPVVSLTGPAPGTQLVRGDTLILKASATDDGRVVRVDFLADGVLVGSGTTTPFTASIKVPASSGSVGVEAIARDTNGNIGRSGVASFALINDPLTTVAGLVQDASGGPVQGAVVDIRAPRPTVETGSAAISGSAMTINPTSHTGASNLSGSISFNAGEQPILDFLVDLEPAGSATVSGALTLDFTGFNPATPMAIPGNISLTGTTATGLSIAVSGPIGAVVPVTGHTTFEVELPVTAFDPDGFSSAQPLAGLPATVRLQGSLELQVVPGTSNVTSVAIDASLTESVTLDLTATTGPDGRFTISRVPTIYGDAVVDVQYQPSGHTVLRGSSSPTKPVRGGTTDVGTIHLGEVAPVALFPYPVFLVGRDPYSVVVGDFNDDGVKDLATANISSNDVSVLLGNGDGTFGAQTRLAAPFGPFSVAAVDLNNDGRLDLVSANLNSNNISIFLGNGNGTFQNSTPQTRVQVGVGSSPIFIATADLNGDARPDVVVADRDSNAISVLLGRGDGSFRPEIRIPMAGGPVGVAIDDYDQDGKLDVAVVDVFTDEVAVLRGNGDGTFAPEIRFPAGDGANAIAAGDLNGDGKPDLATANYSADTVAVFLGIGNGTFGPQSVLPVGHHPVRLIIANLNGGGFQDLIVANQGTEDLSILLGNGDGTLRPESRIPAVSLPAGLAVSDLDGNGTPEIVVTNEGDNNVQVLFGNGDGSFVDQRRIPIPGFNVVTPNPRSIGTADFNSDGKADFVEVELQHNRMGLYIGNGDGTFRSPVYYGVGQAPLQLAVSDFNGDGKPDVVAINQNSDNVSILLGNGDGTFASSGFSLQAPAAPRPLTVADFNNDGKKDLAIGRQVGGIDIYLGVGNGTFSFAGRFATGNSDFLSLTAGDFNGDGKKDVAFSNGGLAVLLGNGDGTFGGVAGVAAGAQVEWVVAGDFNHDGLDDLAAANFISNDITISISNGNGTFRTPVSYHVGEGQSPLFVTTGDFNADGKLDLAMANGETEGRASDDVVMLLGDGTGAFVAGPRLACGKTPVWIAPADFNNDGKQDMAILNRDSISVSILLNLGP